MKRIVLSAALVLTSFATAQRGPLPGMPLVPPPVNHPALLAQPLMQPDNPVKPPRGGQTQKDPPKGVKQPGLRRPKPVDPDTVGAKKSGRDLKKSVERVVKLGWRKSLGEARAHSAATGKPILWVQSLGEIGGFA